MFLTRFCFECERLLKRGSSNLPFDYCFFALELSKFVLVVALLAVIVCIL